MATITIRNLDEKVKRALQVRAAMNGRSMEAEARAFLTEAVTKGAVAGVAKEGLGTTIQNLFASVWSIPEQESLESFETARLKYLPKQISLLFVAEAPPKLNSKRFFYFPIVPTGDTLYLEMMKVLYPVDAGFSEAEEGEESRFSASKLRSRKSEFLSKFRDDGFFLADASEKPMPDRATTTAKERLLRSSLPALTARLSNLCGGQRPGVVLIGNPVFGVCNTPLRDAGFHILNEEPINTPATGGQKQFRRKLGDLLSLHQVAHLKSA